MNFFSRHWPAIVLVAVLLAGGCSSSTSEAPAQAGARQPEAIERQRVPEPASESDGIEAAEAPAEPAPAEKNADKAAKDAEDNKVVTTPKLPPPANFVDAADAAPLKYRVVAVSDGGTITGKVTLQGKAQAPKVFKVEKTPEVCGSEDRLIHEVNANGGSLTDVVVVLEGVKAGKPFGNFTLAGPPPGIREHTGTGEKFLGTTLKPQKCIFGAFTGVIAVGSVLRFDNQDPVKHSPHTYEVRGRVRDSMHNQDLEGNGYLKLGIKFKKDTAKVLKLECDQHNHMQNWFYRVDNPYYAFSGADGTFKIDQVPPGVYKLIAWHPILGELTQEVTIAPNGSSNVTFEFVAGRRPRT